jgi:hypothetical protein
MPRRISRTEFNFLLDATLLMLFVALCTSSVILEFVFPPATQAEGWLLWARSYDQWSRFRFALLATLAAAVVLHVMLHWSWVCGVATSRLRKKRSTAAKSHDDPTRTLWGVGLLIFVLNLVGVTVAIASLTIQSPITSP